MENTSDQDTRRFVIDTDCGVDDAMAMILAVCAAKNGVDGNTNIMKIDAITTIAGNVPIEQASINASKIWEVCDVKIPIYS